VYRPHFVVVVDVVVVYYHHRAKDTYIDNILPSSLQDRHGVIQEEE
jgi:hypothetical protein